MCLLDSLGKINCGNETCPNNGRKMSADNENPIDDGIVNICEKVAEIIRSNDKHKIITPNMITTVGLLMGLIAIALLWKKKYYFAFIFFWICYFFDCLDGYYARRYDMVTQFGDYYDHFRDIFINAVISILIYHQLNTPEEKSVFTIVLIVLIILMCTHFGCQELNSSIKENNACLKVLSPMISHKEYIDYTKYFSSGTFTLVISLFILYLSKINKK